VSTAASLQTDVLIADALASWAARFQLNQVSDDVIHEAKRCILDVIGVSYAGAAHPTVALTREQVSAQYNAGPCSLIGTDVTASSTGAALANGTAAHVWDYDDVSFEGMVHGTAAVWPAVLAVSQASQASGADLLTAFVAGVEAEYALGRAFTPELFFRGWWTTGLLGAIGAAIGAGKAMGLDARVLTQAIGIAAAQATGPYVLVGTPIKPYACGRAAEAGVQAANFALAGLTAPDDVFEHEQGFTAMFGDRTFFADELAKLGDRLVLETSRLTFKRYPVCAGAQGSVEAVLDLIAEHGLTADQVTKVRCEVTPAISHYMQYRVPRDTTEAQFSLPYCIACALLFGGITFQHLTEAAIRNPRTLDELAKVEVVPSETLAEQEKSHEDHIEPAIATIWTVDGRELRTVNRAATGTPQQPISDSELEAKFLACTAPSMMPDEAKSLIARIWKLETLGSALALLPSKR